MYVCLSQLQQMFVPSRKPSTSSRKEIHLNSSNESLQTVSATLRLENTVQFYFQETFFYLQPRTVFNFGIKKLVLPSCSAIRNVSEETCNENYRLSIRKVFPCYTNILSTSVLRLLLLLLLSCFSRVRLCATPSMAAHQAPLSLGFSRQEHWSGWSSYLDNSFP